MKFLLKNILVKILGSQVRRLRRRHEFKILGVVGSIGKTSTKLAIAKVLTSEKRVRYQAGNYNDLVSVPLVFFGQEMPVLWNAFAWLWIILQNELQIWLAFPFDVVVVELGTDGPGQISAFRQYLHLDVAVLTAVTAEHMEFFGSLEQVAEEEWSVIFFSDMVYANKDLCKIMPPNLDHKKIIYYGKDFGSIYKMENVSRTKSGFSFDILFEGRKIMDIYYEALSEIQLYVLCAAVAVAEGLRLDRAKVKSALSGIKSFAGRMQKLKGIKRSVIIDDTYNASPAAVKMALDALYAFPAPQRIAILGMMNELGTSSEREHRQVGEYCDPKFLDWVVTIGEDANAFLAPAALERGCKVYKAKNADDAGLFVKDKIQSGAVILAKGSQNGVFAEEALKPLLAEKADISKLVRQDESWMQKKGLVAR